MCVKRTHFQVFSSHIETVQYFMIFFNKTLFLMLIDNFTFCLNSVQLQEVIFSTNINKFLDVKRVFLPIPVAGLSKA